MSIKNRLLLQWYIDTELYNHYPVKVEVWTENSCIYIVHQDSDMALMFCKMCIIEMHNSQFTQYKASFEQEPFLLTIPEHHTAKCKR